MSAFSTPTLRTVFVLKRLSTEGMGYDALEGVVVIDDSEYEARAEVASLVVRGGGTGEDVTIWRNCERTSCEAIGTTSRERGIVLESWANG